MPSTCTSESRYRVANPPRVGLVWNTDKVPKSPANRAPILYRKIEMMDRCRQFVKQKATTIEMAKRYKTDIVSPIISTLKSTPGNRTSYLQARQHLTYSEKVPFFGQQKQTLVEPITEQASSNQQTNRSGSRMVQVLSQEYATLAIGSQTSSHQKDMLTPLIKQHEHRSPTPEKEPIVLVKNPKGSPKVGNSLHTSAFEAPIPREP